MLVDCPECRRTYRIEASDLGARGRVVICPRCEARWFQKGAKENLQGSAGWSRVRTIEQPTSEGIAARAAGARRATSTNDAAMLAAGRPASSGAMLRGLRVAATAFAVLATAGGIIEARASVVRVVPRAASLYAAIGLPVNLRGLRFVRVEPGPAEGSVADLSIRGSIRNVTRARVRVPRLVFEVRDGVGATLVRWSEAPPASSLATGGSIPFASRAQRMPPGGHSVLVSFEDQSRDDGAGETAQHIAAR